MASDFVWMRREFPWLRPGFVHAVHSDGLSRFRRQLRDLKFELFEMLGSPQRSVFDQLADAFAFPEYYGGNWDAFNDCIGDIEPPPRSALLWHAPDLHAGADPKRFGEACSMLTRVFDVWSTEGSQALLVLVGSTDTFDHPN
jgi:RNAse (barnase) inhibitor barstar